MTKNRVLCVIAAGHWIGASEFVQNELLFKSCWLDKYRSLGLEFPSAVGNSAVWGNWSFIFAGLICCVSNKPADPAPAAAADPPGPTWDDLVTELGLEPHELTHQLLQDHGAPSLMARPALFASLVTPSTTNLAKSLLLCQSAPGDPAHALMALQD